MYVRMYACMHVCMYVCMCGYSCTYVRMYVCMYVCIYAGPTRTSLRQLVQLTAEVESIAADSRARSQIPGVLVFSCVCVSMYVCLYFCV